LCVNGPAEAHDSQLGITFGRGVGMIFNDGVPMRKVAGENIVDAFVAETENFWQKVRRRVPDANLTRFVPDLFQSA
jgi:(E)-4-hydroxy-3-methylbut-2-enyl-diphosphate synthase